MHTLSRLAAVALLPTIGLAQGVGIADAWQEFTKTNGAGWHVQWNAATGTPAAIFGPGLKIDGPVTSLATARVEATRLFQRYAEMLGKGESDFVEIIGTKVRQVYILVYDQEYKGLPVISGRADVRINDVGVVALFGSRAVEIPAGFNLTPTLTAAAATAHADESILAQPGNPKGRPASQLVIWANTESGLPTKATLAWEVQIDERPREVRVGKAYIDATSGDLLQFKNEVVSASSVFSTARRAGKARAETPKASVSVSRPADSAPVAITGTVMAWVNKGHLPTDTLTNVPMANLQVTSSAGSAFTDANGQFSIPNSGTSAVTVTATLTGKHTKRVRVVQGTQMSGSASITPGTPRTIQLGTSSMNQFDRSQTTTYWFTDDVNVWLRSLLPGSSAQIDLMSAVNPRVNIASSCNAYYTNFTINFYHRSSTCANTAFETVIQHEWGHGIDHAFGGLSQTDGLSEGWGDLLCIYRSQQPQVGPGFRIGQTNGLRSGTNTRTYPAGGGVHQQGQTWMGWAWDLRGYLMSTHGAATGEALAHQIVVASIAADATNQPDAVREVFILDDNDGNLNNGTPNYSDLEKASLKRKLPYPKRTNPNAGSYQVYGLGCPGSGKSSTGCGSNNGRASGSRNLGQNLNTFALGVPAPTGQTTVTGFELFTRGTAGALTIATQIYLANAAGQPTGNPVRTGTLQISATLGWYKTTFATPLVINAGQKFFLSYTSAAGRMLFPMASSGVFGEHYWHSPTSTGWRGPFRTALWAWRVNCATGTGALPVLTNNGVPEIGQSFALELSSAKPSAAALLLIGASDTQWGTIPLPLNLGFLGAPKCDLLSSGEVIIGSTTSTTGTNQQTFNVPNTTGLIGVTFFNQFVIEDSKNAFGLVFSNGGKGKVGKQ